MRPQQITLTQTLASIREGKQTGKHNKEENKWREINSAYSKDNFRVRWISVKNFGISEHYSCV